MRKFGFSFLIVLFLSPLLDAISPFGSPVGSKAWASSFYSRPFPMTVQDSPLIVRGMVESSSSDWSSGSDGVRRLYTFYSFSVKEVFKGDLTDPKISLRELGGEKDGLAMEVSGSAHFEKGEDVVVLLGLSNADGSYDIQGLMMGKLNVQKDEEGSEYLVGPSVDGPSHMLGEVQGEMPSRMNQDPRSFFDPKRPRKWTLAALRNLIASQSAVVKAVSNPTPTPVRKVSAPPTMVTAAPQLQPSSSSEGFNSSSEAGEGRSPILIIFALGIILVTGIWALRRFRNQ